MAKKVKRVVNNRLKRAYGQTTIYSDGTAKIEINKKRHATIKRDPRIAKKDATLINTIVHEEMHAQHPKMHEKTVRRLTAPKVASMTTSQKQKHYSKYSKYA